MKQKRIHPNVTARQYGIGLSKTPEGQWVASLPNLKCWAHTKRKALEAMLKVLRVDIMPHNSNSGGQDYAPSKRLK